jgi:hypothetical protein
MQEIKNIRKHSGKNGSISNFSVLIYIKAITFLVFNLEANIVLLWVYLHF